MSDFFYEGISEENLYTGTITALACGIPSNTIDLANKNIEVYRTMSDTRNGIILYKNRKTHRVEYSKCTISSCGNCLRLFEVRTPTLKIDVVDSDVIYLCDNDFGQWFDGQHAKYMVFLAEEREA